MVPVPLLEAFYGPQGVMKEASSNKAARLVHGKTIHAAHKLCGLSGGFVPERRHPFRSSSSDVHQVVFRCNGDVQIKDRAVPTDATAHSSGATEPASSEPSGTGGLVFGSRSFSPLKKR